MLYLLGMKGIYFFRENDNEFPRKGKYSHSDLKGDSVDTKWLPLGCQYQPLNCQ